MDPRGPSLKSQKLGYPVDGDDEKLVSGLSTVLVASIQEAKDRISQIEFIFCSQLYPHFQIEELEREIGVKCEEIDEGLVLQKNLVEMVQSKAVKIQEAEHWEELHKKLAKQINVENSELLENKKKLDLHEKEKQLLLDKFKCLEEKLNLPHKVRSGTEESSDVVDLYEKAIRQIESVTSEMQEEKKKRLHVTDAYKRLKSQHNYLREKVGLTSENMLHQTKLETDLCKLKNTITEPGLMLESPNTSTDNCNINKVKTEFVEDDFGGLENKTPDTFVATCDMNKVKEERSEDDRGTKSDPPSSSFHHVLKGPTNPKSASLSGTKRSASSWRQTRSHQSRGGTDLHDDFLDTPLENVRANLNKASNNEDLPEPVQKDICMDNSDDETQDVNPKSSPQRKQSSVPLASKKTFKYIEPVRKKAERENLKGVECKQCKKFFDAVLPSDESKDPDGSKQKFRCEHLDGVSRHRYRYVPPMTPEGFWNIGFESEL
ncbi:protein gamma response 1 [Senna tora]|uniref:Protein gamma response 1 n=1 Tax=Senna tora TaxID=362788 RepID=A0A834X022_9FABA|nr:protein gamma response 1 [Senna tora]